MNLLMRFLILQIRDFSQDTIRLAADKLRLVFEEHEDDLMPSKKDEKEPDYEADEYIAIKPEEVQEIEGYFRHLAAYGVVEETAYPDIYIRERAASGDDKAKKMIEALDKLGPGIVWGPGGCQSISVDLLKKLAKERSSKRFK